jgi:hypothetical protein
MYYDASLQPKKFVGSISHHIGPQIFKGKRGDEIEINKIKSLKK